MDDGVNFAYGGVSRAINLKVVGCQVRVIGTNMSCLVPAVVVSPCVTVNLCWKKCLNYNSTLDSKFIFDLFFNKKTLYFLVKVIIIKQFIALNFQLIV